MRPSGASTCGHASFEHPDVLPVVSGLSGVVDITRSAAGEQHDHGSDDFAQRAIVDTDGRSAGGGGLPTVGAWSWAVFSAWRAEAAEATTGRQTDRPPMHRRTGAPLCVALRDMSPVYCVYIFCAFVCACC